MILLMKQVLHYITETVRSASPHGLPVLIALFAVTLVLALVGGGLAWPVVLILIAAIAVYADRPRHVPEGTGLVLAPVDGYITGVIENQGLPLAFDRNNNQTESFRRITFRGSVRNCRVVRAPVSGTVREILRATPGDTMAKDATSGMPWSHMDNVSILIAGEDGAEFALVLRGVLIPHQIVLSVQVGDVVRAGDQIGLARFYVTADVYVAPFAPLLRTPGHMVMAGETVLMAASFQHAPMFRTI